MSRKKNDEILHLWILDSPEFCRNFLKSITWGDDKKDPFVGVLVDEDGREYSIDEADDEMVVDFVKSLTKNLTNVKKRKRKYRRK